MGDTKKSGTFQGKSNKLGHGGRAVQLKSQGVPGGVIGEIAREKKAAPGQAHYILYNGQVPITVNREKQSAPGQAHYKGDKKKGAK